MRSLSARGGRLSCAAGVAGLLVAGTLVATAGPAAADAYNFDSPTSAVAVGADLFVANGAGNSLTELNASTGALVAVLSGPSYQFDHPTAIAAVGGDLFVANGAGSSLTEVDASTGALVRVISGTADHFSDPIGLVARSGPVYVLSAGGSVTAVAATSGRALWTASGPTYGFSTPTGIATGLGHVFVTNSTSNSVTELDASTGALVAILSGRAYGFSTPTGDVVANGSLWVTNNTPLVPPGDGSVSRVSASTGKALGVQTSGNLPSPGPIAAGDGDVFAASPPGGSPMITQITSSPFIVEWMMCNTNYATEFVFDEPVAMVVTGTTLWVINGGGGPVTGGSATGSVTAISAVSGNLIGYFD
jgi:hypothetical protein